MPSKYYCQKCFLSPFIFAQPLNRTKLMNAATQDIAVPPAPHEEAATAPPLPAASEQQQQPAVKKKKKWSEHIEGSLLFLTSGHC